MGHQDQCPSTRGTLAPQGPRRVLQTVGGTGKPMWRSVEEVADTPEFRDFLEREFPAGASELLSESRRDFMKIMGAGLALAGAATIPGCRRPDYKIMPYSRDVPEEVIPGKPLYYATSMALPGGGAEGLLVESHEGRPTKIEGNPLHPNNRGKSSAIAQAWILGLYDPDRLKYPSYRSSPNAEAQVGTWDDFRIWWDREAIGPRFDGAQGAGLAILVDKKSSPTRDFVRDRVRARWPQAIWAAYDPLEAEAPARALVQALGAPHREVLHLAHAACIVSLDRDFLNTTTPGEPGGMTNAREFAAMRRPMRSGDPMNRLYAIEGGFSVTGAQADHRMAVAPSRVSAAAVLLAREVARLLGDDRLAGVANGVNIPEDGGLDRRFIEAAAADLVDNRERGLVVAGATQPEAIHLLVIALNRALGNSGRTVTYVPTDPASDESASSANSIRAIANAIDRSQIDTLICIGVNPVFDAPADLNFSSKFARVRRTITLAVESSETAAASTWALNGAHPLEAWGDTRSHDGTVAPVQPLVAPLFEPAMSEVEFLAWLSGDPVFVEPAATPGVPGRVSGYLAVRECWRARGWVPGDFEKGFKRILHDGVVHHSEVRGSAASDAVFQAAAGAVSRLEFGPAPTSERLEVVFQAGNLGDGRFANNPWLQELPAFGTRVVWDNPVLVSPATAKALGVMPEPYTEKEPKARMASVSVGGRSVDLPVWLLPGMADGVAIVTLGYGRTSAGTVGDGVGFDTYPLRASDAMQTARGATLSKTGKKYFIASTQNHWSMEGRTSIVRQIDKEYFDRYASKPIALKPDDIYGAYPGNDGARLTLAEQMGELSHTPPNVSSYENPYNASKSDPDPHEKLRDRLGRTVPPAYTIRPQWGMSVDQSTCTGCSACIIACQAENNIPNVGKREVAKGREMHWIRVDRYYTGDDWRQPEEMVHQPVMCVQCENAPCETVCPVNATIHDEQGLNIMAYNRCIGTRYCSNNCPYKVRRFNFFDWGQTKFNGAFVGEETIGRPRNVNFIPPRLRERLDEVTRMQKNPDVTVRGRGVMEKCNFCLQRLNQAKFEMKLQDLQHIPDGFVQVACAQACPSGAISFGDLLDEHSRVRTERENHRSYLLLGYLNTRPRTTHMLRVRNPNPALRASVDPLHGHGGHGNSHDNGHGASPPEGPQHGFLYDPRKKREDDGYALSLRVLDAMGVNA